MRCDRRYLQERTQHSKAKRNRMLALTQIGEAFLCRTLATVTDWRNTGARAIQGPARGARLRKVLSARVNAWEGQITANPWDAKA